MWYLTFEHEAGLHEWLLRCRGLLADEPAVNTVPEPWLHCTVDDVAFLDELSGDRVAAVADAGARELRGWTSPRLTLGPVVAMDDALVLQMQPAAALDDLRDRVRRASLDVLGAQALPALERFEPHVTIAYANRRSDPVPLLRRLAGVRDDRLVTGPARLSLAAVTRRSSHYQWQTQHVVPPEQAQQPAQQPVEEPAYLRVRRPR